MTITLPPELARQVRRRLETGRYESETQLIEQALLALDGEDEILADVRRKIEVGVKELDAGLGVELDLEEFLKRANARNQSHSTDAK